MSDTPPEHRTFDRDEVALILRDAAQLDAPNEFAPPGALRAESDADGLTMAQIEEAASAVGISSAALNAAWMRRSLATARDEWGRTHVSRELRGELSPEALRVLVNDVRTLSGPATVRSTADGVEVEIGATGGGPGSMTLQIRSSAGATTISAWSHPPAMSRGDIASCGLLGAPAFLFPVVAASGGHWPAVGIVAALASAGAAAGAGVGAAFNRWRISRWNDRVERIVVPIALRVSELMTRASDD